MKVYFFTCTCGLQLKVVVQNIDEQKSTYVCRCLNKTQIHGSVVMMFSNDIGTPQEPIWIPIPKKQIV